MVPTPSCFADCCCRGVLPRMAPCVPRLNPRWTHCSKWHSWSLRQFPGIAGLGSRYISFPKALTHLCFLWQMAWCLTALQLDSSLYCREAPSFISTTLSMMELLGTGKSWETLIIRLGRWPPEENNTLLWPGNNTQWINQLASVYLALIPGIVW